MNNFLVIEDDDALREVIHKSLAKRGYTVQGASTIADANKVLQSLFQQNRFVDYAIVDLKLNDETTLAFLPKLRAHNIEMKIVMLTGYASIATAVEAVKLGADNYLPKPATINEILFALA